MDLMAFVDARWTYAHWPVDLGEEADMGRAAFYACLLCALAATGFQISREPYAK